MAPVQTRKNGFNKISPSYLSKGNGNVQAVAQTTKKMIQECGRRLVLPDVFLQEQELFNINHTVKRIYGIIDAKDNKNTPASMKNNNTNRMKEKSRGSLFTL